MKVESVIFEGLLSHWCGDVWQSILDGCVSITPEVAGAKCGAGGCRWAIGV